MGGLRAGLRRRGRPVAAGAVAGLLFGLVGMAAAPSGVFPFAAGMLGAVVGGATAAALTDGGVGDATLNAVVADVLSSVAFFALFLSGYIGYVAYTEGITQLEAAFALLFVGGFGAAVATPIAVVSVLIAALSGATASVAIRRVHGAGR